MNPLTIKPTNLSIVISIVLLLCFSSLTAQTKTFEVTGFDKVIVSPHISVTFKKGNKTSVVVESTTEPIEKFNVEVNNKTLELFLDDAKITTKEDKQDNHRSVPKYKGTVIKAIVTYVDVETFSLRGAQRFDFESPMEMNKITLNIYGESQVYLKEVHVKEMKVIIYGKSFLKIDKGEIAYQKITAYGESSVNLLDIKAIKTKLTAYGDGSFQFNVSEELKVTSYGEPTITYKGDAKVKTGLSFGEVSIVKLN